MRTWIDDALDLLERRDAVAMVTIAAVAGSAPREAGAKMLVAVDALAGTIGGGALEHTCIGQARALLAKPDTGARAQDYPLGPLLGQCCGGRVRIAIELLTREDRPWLETASILHRDGAPYRLVLALDGARSVEGGWTDTVHAPGVALLGVDGEMLQPQARERWLTRVEYVQPRARRVMLIGGGHVGAALAGMLRNLPLSLDWIDPRPGEDDLALGGARLGDPLDAVRLAQPGTAFLIMTHSHALDFDLCEAALRRSDALYCGVIGSKSKRARFLNRLAAAGLSEEIRSKLVCPIGAVGLAGKEPSVIALAAATEIMLAFEAREAGR